MARPGFLSRIGWFALLWLAGVAVVGAISFALKLVIG